jgi:2-haloacid dehalogenase
MRARAAVGLDEGRYVKYRSVLEQEVQEAGREAGKSWGFEPEFFEVCALAASLRHWEPFPDTVEALDTWTTGCSL